MQIAIMVVPVNAQLPLMHCKIKSFTESVPARRPS